jgi:hypothetical protein
VTAIGAAPPGRAGSFGGRRRGRVEAAGQPLEAVAEPLDAGLVRLRLVRQVVGLAAELVGVDGQGGRLGVEPPGAGIVALCAVGFAALRYPSALSLAGMRLLTFGTVGYSTLGIIYRDGVKRAGRVGFAIFAGGCLLIQMYAGMSGEDAFYEIGRCLLALACGPIGALIAIRLYNTREAADRGPIG